MYNYTNGSEIWAQRLTGFINKTSIFFPEQNKGILTEPCEGPQNCNGDMVSFKGYLARWFAVSAQLAPFTAPMVIPHLQKSGIAAAQSCVGPATTSSLSYECGNRWYWDGYDGKSGVGQQLAALSIISANMVQHAKAPMTANSGGTSKGDPGLGTGKNEGIPTLDEGSATAGDKAGAAILTIFMAVSTVGGAYWLIR
jgi:mannan endo-1,6-alpha-mannosidase